VAIPEEYLPKNYMAPDLRITHVDDCEEKAEKRHPHFLHPCHGLR
jgi:hypothetical protein